MYQKSRLGSTTLSILNKQGFHLPGKPDSHPVLVANLDDLSDHELMEDFALFTSWADYASAQVGLAVIAEREAEQELEQAEGAAWREHMAKFPKSPVSVAKAVVGEDDDVVDARKNLNVAHAYRRMVSDISERYLRDAAVLSRELTRRTTTPPVRKRNAL